MEENESPRTRRALKCYRPSSPVMRQCLRLIAKSLTSRCYRGGGGGLVAETPVSELPDPIRNRRRTFSSRCAISVRRCGPERMDSGVSVMSVHRMAVESSVWLGSAMAAEVERRALGFFTRPVSLNVFLHYEVIKPHCHVENFGTASLNAKST